MPKIWNNLLSNKCPVCKCGLVKGETGEIIECGRPKCRFKISEDKFTATVNNLHKPVKKNTFEHSEEENLQELNKL